MKYIYHHLGLGDHIICNGLVRSLIKPNEKYKMFVKQHNLTSVKFMYRDLNNLDFIIGDDNFAKKYLKENNIKNENLISAGFYRHPNSKTFDESFYLQNNLSFDNRWNNFYLERDLKSESILLDKFNVKEYEYVFIHDDSTRNYIIEDSEINKKFKIIRPIKGLTDNIFDYCTLISKSHECHFIDSSFRLMTDSLSLKNDNLYYHISMKNGTRRNTDSWADSTSKLNFRIINN